ncbi:MAG TPA: nodulation protein NfeD [Candidatus Omnitrophota bacterium]|nr:nodulation protein NfeD [Candidatus Omnitrophota bacterium]HPD85458.1 nodulation protein NfeD [Candidatus Omnitrophota bacterium]HRZ04041.1 nodulation protein NfeD [Candidatus Omnitrophota bacterium]
MSLGKKIIVYSVFCLSFLLSGLSDLPENSFLHAAANTVDVIELNDDTINPVTADYIMSAVDEAERQGAQCLIIKLDTPGGLLSSTRSIVKKILGSSVPVVVYISPSGSRAGSAGVFITYASHVAAMAPSTNIGAAHPVEMGGRSGEQRTIWDALRDMIDSTRDRNKKNADGVSKETKTATEKNPESAAEDPMSSKILNDTVAFIQSMAKERGRNIEWAKESVTKSYSITEKEALERNVIEIIATDDRDLLAQLDGRTVTIGDRSVVLRTKDASLRHIAMDMRQRILNILANPNIAYIFFILGFYGLLFEVTHTGAVVPGVLGTIFIILAFFSMQMLPTNYAGLALIVLAIILFIAEAKTAGFGLFTLGGLVCMVLGSLMLFDSTVPLMRVSLGIIFAFSFTTAAITIFLVRLVIISHRKKVVSGKEGLIGEKGSAQTHLLPGVEGMVFVHGEMWTAVSQEEIKKDAAIVVAGIDGMTLKVKKA